MIPIIAKEGHEGVRARPVAIAAEHERHVNQPYNRPRRLYTSLPVSSGLDGEPEVPLVRSVVARDSLKERSQIYLAATTDRTVIVSSFAVPLTVTFCPANFESSASCPSKV